MLNATAVLVVVVVCVVALALGYLIGRGPGRSKRDAAENQFVDRVAEAVRQQYAEASSPLSEKADSIADRLGAVDQAVIALRASTDQSAGRVIGDIEGVAKLTSRLSRLLDNPATRGCWGEKHVADVLNAAGFREGVSYFRQVVLPDGRKPDFTIPLREDLNLHLEVKTPSVNYQRYLDAVEAGDPAEQAEAKKAFISNVDAMVRDTAERDFAKHDDSVNVVALCIPNEGIFEFMHRADPGLIDKALKQRVVLCSVSTLFAVLAVVHQSVENFRLSRETDEILTHLNGFKQQWSQFTGHLEKADKQFGTFHTSWEALTGTRRRQLERSMSRIDHNDADTPELEGTQESEVAEPHIAPTGIDISDSAAAS